MPSAVQRIAEHRNVEQLLLPTDCMLFQRGDSASALCLERGLVELTSGGRDRLRYSDGEVFFYEDLVADDAHHSRTARAITPLQALRLDRNSFLELIHGHPTPVLSLLSGQHRRLREQRLDPAHFY